MIFSIAYHAGRNIASAQVTPQSVSEAVAVTLVNAIIHHRVNSVAYQVTNIAFIPTLGPITKFFIYVSVDAVIVLAALRSQNFILLKTEVRTSPMIIRRAEESTWVISCDMESSSGVMFLNNF
jgi:hypothetical protein